MNPVLVKWLRVVSQIGFLALFLLVVAGTFCAFALPASFAFVCPLGAMQVTVSTLTIRWATVLGGLLLLAITLLLGRAFCGWACPFGTIVDGVRGLLRLVPRLRSAGRWLPGRTVGPAEPARGLKYGLLMGALGGAALLRYPVFCPICPIGTTCRSAGLQGVTGGLEMAVVPAVASLELYKGRGWCRYACPVGALMALVDRFSQLKLNRIRLPAADCLGCNRCNHFCPMENNPLRSAGQALRQDPEVIRAALQAGHPDILSRPVKRSELPDVVREALYRRDSNYRVAGGECTRCFECKSACPAVRLPA